MSKKNNNQQRADQRRRQASAGAVSISEREQRQATVIGMSVCIIVVSLIVAVIAVVWALNRPADTANSQADGNTNSQSQGQQSQSKPLTLQQAQAEAAAVKPAPAHSDYKGGFLFSKNGLNKPIRDAPTVQVYTDFICPFCGIVDRQLFPTWNKMLAAGQLNLEIHPCSFLDGSSNDDYSTRSACAAAYIADKDPSHALAFVQSMFDESFQPKEGWEYRPTSDADIVNQAKKAGVSPAVAKQSVKGTYSKWIKAISDYTPLRTELQHPDGANKGEFGTPTLVINGKYWDYGAATANGASMPDAFCNALGIDSAAAGHSGTMPSIGSGEEPRV